MVFRQYESGGKHLHNCLCILIDVLRANKTNPEIKKIIAGTKKVQIIQVSAL
jgi:hypothetical protein